MADQDADHAPEESLTLSRLLAMLETDECEPVTRAYLRVRESREKVDYEAVVTLLADLSVELGLDLEPAGNYFATAQLADDPDDYINPEDVTLEQFCKRLKTFCARLVNAQVEESSRKETPTKELSARASQDGERSRRSQRSDEDRTSAEHVHEQGAGGPAGKLMARMVARRTQLEAALASQDPSVLTKSVVEECGLKPSEEQMQQLTLELVEAFPLAAEEVPADQFSDLQTVVCRWAEQAQLQVEEEDPLAKKLRESIADFESMREAKFAAGEDASMLDGVLKTLKAQLAKISRDNAGMSMARKQQIFHERCAKTLREVFRFYSNQLRLLGKTPSFETIQRNSMILNVSKFVRFCRDFELLIDKSKKTDVKTLELATVKNVFVKNSVLQKEMEEEQFRSALDMLAHLYFDQEYDELNRTEVSGKTTEEKRDMLYRFLKFDQGSECLRSAKGFGLPFSSKTDNRVPENDLMKNYKYRPYHGQRPMLEEWKQQKAMQLASSKQPQKESTPPKRAPADAIVSYSSQPPVAEPYIPQKYAKKARNPYTWKTLGELNPEEVLSKEEDFDLNNLIADDSSDEDEILKKQYPLAASQPTLQPEQKPEGKTNKFSTPLLGGVKPNALIKSESRPNLEQKAKKMLQHSKEMSVSEMRKEKAQLDKAMKISEAQRERGNKVLGRLRQNS